MGYTFKENCSDTRNTKVHDLILSLRDARFKLRVWDPHIDIKTIEALNKDEILASQKKPNNVELAFICVYHKEILEFLDSYDGLVYDFRKLNKI